MSLISKMARFLRRENLHSPPPVAPIFTSLRSQILQCDPSLIGLDRASCGPVWALVMDTAYSTGIVTLVVVADGNVSIYLSNGGGIIGTGRYDGPRRACTALLAAAPTFQQHARKTAEFPLPEIGHTSIYFLTFDGAYLYTALEDDLGNKRTPLSPLFHAAHEVIVKVREADANHVP